jgi:D-ribose pyranase
MLRNGIINPEVARVLAGLRHTDRLVISDSGLPVAADQHVVDLAVVYGTPSFELVARAVVDALVIEGAIVATEMRDTNPSCLALVETLVDAPLERIPHELFKTAAADAVAVIRTGEATPYANLILQCGAPFG